ncbi:MAG: hypothetical protein ACM31O_17405 [Bacteroidota bacterium]
MGEKPRVFGTLTLDERWQRVSFVRSPIGVPQADAMFCPHAEALGLLGYASAQSLRWWFHAEHGQWNLESRLVEHAVEWSYKEQAVGAVEDVAGPEARRPVKPDSQPVAQP